VTEPGQELRIVGIGASAGGLDALKQLLASLPVRTGMAFVVLQHVAASQTGVLRNALAGSTEMPVLDLKSGTNVEVDHVYVVPPHVDAVLLNGAFVLRSGRPGTRARLPIDTMMQSLASALGSRATGVILSGTAHDGSAGLRAIHEAGGLTFAQDPATAQFDEMPRNAIATGAVGEVLGASEIGVALGMRVAVTSAVTGIALILSILRDATGVDFHDYKRPTIERRISRRVLATKQSSLESYAELLSATPEEISLLSEDLLIHVTEFFREPSTLDLLSSRVFPEILGNLPEGEAIRLWVPGCSTGQEVYSLAILLLEFLEGEGDRRPIQIFGSDLSERAVEVARAGIYPDTTHVSPDRLARFFTREDGGWRVVSSLRERCVFVRHDLTGDPPFSKLDLISCRNVLIYMGSVLQQSVIPMFHYALNQPGFLILGRVESITTFVNLFERLDPAAPIFARQPTAGHLSLTFALGRSGRFPFEPKQRERAPAGSELQRDVDNVLLARYAPACVLITGAGEILQFRGRTGRFLEPASGTPQANLFKMARGGLGAEIRAVLLRAQREDRATRRDNITFREEGETRVVHIEVVPLSVSTSSPCFVVIFEDDPGTASKATRRRRRSTTSTDAVHREEFAATKEYLHSALAQHAIANEELGVANEELQSMNEELLSMNEELQTAKEEQQSTNEELETVNEELRKNNEQTMVLNDDLVNVLASVEIAIIIVDRARRVQRFTPSARSIMNLIPSDIGREIGDLRPIVVVDGLESMISDVIETLVMHVEEVADASGHTFRMQIRPYRNSDQRIDGAVLSFVDVSTLHRSIEEAKSARDYASAIVEAVPNPLVVIDRDHRIRSANRAFFDSFHVTDAVLGVSLLRFGEGSWRALGGHDLEKLLADGAPSVAVVEREERGDVRTFQIGVRDVDGRPDRLMLVGMLDLTEQIRMESSRDSFLNAVSHELRTPLNAILLWAQVLRRGELATDRVQHALETIELSALMEARLVDDLLDVAASRRGTESLTVSLREVDPLPIVRSAIDAVRVDADAKRVVLDSDLEDGLVVCADPLRLGQIVRNLATNAIKFTPPGGRIAVRLSRQLENIELGVTDTGLGISADVIGRIFEPFWQQDVSSTRAVPGLGIGLALVRHLVERQGGTIRVDSRGEGSGTSFTIQLPSVRERSLGSALAARSPSNPREIT